MKYLPDNIVNIFMEDYLKLAALGCAVPFKCVIIQTSNNSLIIFTFILCDIINVMIISRLV